MYCSGVWSYIVGAIATPFFIAVPLVTIWAGIFPIVVSKWAASKPLRQYFYFSVLQELCQDQKACGSILQKYLLFLLPKIF